jgi:DNA (cytosine-5)-methyltransferase 1
VSTFLTRYTGTGDGSAMGDPLGTLTTRDRFGLVNAFLTKFHGTSIGQDARTPLGTVMAGGEHYGIVTVEGQPYRIADIGMRMLAPRELYRAQGFPDSYRIDVLHDGSVLSKTAQVRMVGNSVSPPLAAAVVRANVARPARATYDHRQLELTRAA